MKESIVKSLRMRPELWAFVAERASKQNISPNAWLARMVEQVRKGKLKEEK